MWRRPETLPVNTGQVSRAPPQTVITVSQGSGMYRETLMGILPLMSIPSSAITLTARGFTSGAGLVPADLTVHSGQILSRYAAAIWLRQLLPVQIMRTFIVSPLRFRRLARCPVHYIRRGRALLTGNPLTLHLTLRQKTDRYLRSEIINCRNNAFFV